MKKYDLIVIGAGPAGLSAAIEAASQGMSVVVFDENAKPGGQLFKQIHKFFGSKEHKAKIRGFHIGEQLLREAETAHVQVELNSVVTGIYGKDEVVVMKQEELVHYKSDAVIVATGAAENMVTFQGWTLPGVIGAGAAQTMMNIHGVKPGDKVLMVGTGNVGLVVSYQLMQAGCEVVAIVDVAPKVGGYGVHAAKVARTGVPFYLSHTVVKAKGDNKVQGAIIAEVDMNFSPINGTEKELDVDTICLAVGLSPMAQLVHVLGCEMEQKGGDVPITDKYGMTSIPGIFAVGDVAGIEEASSAMIQGRIAGNAVARYLGYEEDTEFQEKYQKLQESLSSIRTGMFAPVNRGKHFTETQEGYALSENLLKKGYIDERELGEFPSIVKKKAGVHPIIECTQNIPCNPCQDACKFGCISIGNNITNLPIVTEAVCKNCGMCVASCSGQAIFLINEDYEPEYATVSIPYEFIPLPEIGETGWALDRSGKIVSSAQIIDIKYAPAMDQTRVLTMRVPKEMAMKARFYKKQGGISCE